MMLAIDAVFRQYSRQQDAVLLEDSAARCRVEAPLCLPPTAMLMLMMPLLMPSRLCHAAIRAIMLLILPPYVFLLDARRCY